MGPEWNDNDHSWSWEADDGWDSDSEDIWHIDVGDGWDGSDSGLSGSESSLEDWGGGWEPDAGAAAADQPWAM